MVKHSTEYHEALDSFIDSRRGVPFMWGANDCCTFAADWVQKVRGVDPMADLRGLETELQALRVVKDMGGIRAAVSERMGAPIAGAFAQAGDLCLIRNDDRLSMGVCVGASVAIPSEHGLAFGSIALAEAAWRV